VDLDRRQRELLDDHRVLDLLDFLDGLSLDELGDVARARDRAAATEGLEARILDDAVVADLELELHHVAALRRADDPRPDVRLVLLEGADVPGIRVVIDHLVAIGRHSSNLLANSVRALRSPARPSVLRTREVRLQVDAF